MLAAALFALVSVALCIRAIVSLDSGLALFGITCWFTVPGLLLAWLVYEPAPGRTFATWVLTMMVALTAATMLVGERRWVTLATGGLAGAAAFAWTRGATPADAGVQFEPHAREGRRWADVPAFAERRMSAGLPISMVPLTKYEEASTNVLALYQEHDPDAAFSRAARLGIDYVIVGPTPARKMFPDFEAPLRSRPSRFREAFRSGDVSVYMLEGGV
jgi:hypothetical protein